MTKAETQIVEIDISDLIRADWNYKTDGSPEQIAKLMESIKEDRSAGVLAVRELDGKFEVIDGNHRLEAVLRVGWGKVPCENFGKISKAKAITIARRRNHKWFADDVLKYAELFRNDVLAEINMDDLERYMPDTREEMENLSKLLDFDWSQFRKEDQGGDEDAAMGKKLVLELPEETYNLWLKWKERYQSYVDDDSNEKIFEFAIGRALELPDETFE